MTTSESKGRFFYKTNRFESIRITNRIESIRIANWNALLARPSRLATPSDWLAGCYSVTIRYDTRCYFNVRSKADMSRLNLPHGNDN